MAFRILITIFWVGVVLIYAYQSQWEDVGRIALMLLGVAVFWLALGPIIRLKEHFFGPTKKSRDYP